MQRSNKLDARIYEMGRLINLRKDDVKNALKNRRNIVIAGILALFAFILVQNITYGTLRYQPPGITDFLQFGRFL